MRKLSGSWRWLRFELPEADYRRIEVWREKSPKMSRAAILRYCIRHGMDELEQIEPSRKLEEVER